MLRGACTFFDNDDLVQLRRVLDAACSQLVIGKAADALMREHLANLIMQMACRGRDPQEIQDNILVLKRR
ncbi:MAG TPA: hypothetical protein VEA77_02030 [Hyphomicrobium sp.]|nr:hypothetical protein [Hyphomicrobium sp.]